MSRNTDQAREVLPANAEKLSDLVGYSPGSIVSRRLIQKPAGNVTLFAFDKSQELSEHTSPFDALVYVIDGEARIFISGKPLTAKKGDIVIMPANRPHALKALKKFKMLLILVKS
jgi:quercetin dioxygenase-like cupin family protein